MTKLRILHPQISIHFWHMKRILSPIILLSSVIIFLFSQCEKENNNEYDFQFHFITEEYEPLNYTENGKLTGLAPDLLEMICKSLNIPFQVEVLSWSEGYNLVKEKDNAVLFSTALNAERKEMFKWAGPIAALEWYFYADAQNPLVLRSLDDARKLGAIGVLQDYSIEQFLVQQGFTNLVYCNDHQDAFQKLLNGEIDLYPSDRITARAALQALGQSFYQVVEKKPIRTEMIYFAFNKNVPDVVVADIQEEIDRLKDNGYLRRLSQKYLNTSDYPGTLQVYTEDYPPLTFMNPFGEITGFGTDIVYEIMNRNKVFANIKLSTWNNGYELALHNPNFCLFTMDRTEIRESLFQWVGPIGTNATFFYTRAGSGISIGSLADARSLSSVGTVSSWYSDQALRELGFTNLVSENEPGIMTKKLMLGEIDAFVCSAVTFPTILKEQGYEYDQVTEAFTLMSSDFYIAFSKNTSATIVNQWQEALEAMQQDGTYEAIHQKWFP
jgi:ABC-type amino acid transport substrate-binding protein